MALGFVSASRPTCVCASGFKSANRPTLLAGCVRQPPNYLSGVCRYHPLQLPSQGAPSVHSPIYCQICLVFIYAILLESELLLIVIIQNK